MKATSTKEMLADIGCGTAADVVLDARYTNCPFGPTFVGQLDDVLAAARPHPSGSRLERGDLVEVTGPSGSGKTTLLLFMLVGSLLPSSATFHYPNPVHLPLGGRGQHAALLYPSTHRSPLPKLERGLRQYIGNAIHHHMGDITYKPELVHQVDTLVAEAMGRLRVVKVGPRARNKSWALALRSLSFPPARPHTREEEPRGGLDLVVCDGFADGFYPERWNDEHAKSGGGGGAKRRPVSALGLRMGEDIGMSDVVAAMNALRRDMGSVIVLSVQGLWANGSFFATHLPAPYPAPFTNIVNTPGKHPGIDIQISLHGPVRPLQFPPDHTLIEALYKRLNVRDGASKTFEGHVRVVAAEDKGEIGSAAGVKFRYEVGSSGIEAWHDPSE